MSSGEPDICSGSFEIARARPGPDGPRTFLPTARCEVCGKWVEIHPTSPGPDPYDPDLWRLEAHDPTSGRTIRLGADGNPASDALRPSRDCEQCGGTGTVAYENVAPDLVASCSKCGQSWVTGHANHVTGR